MGILEPIDYKYSISYKDLQKWIVQIILNTSIKNSKLKENNSFRVDKDLTQKIKTIIDSINTKGGKYSKTPKRACIFYQNYRLENFIRKNADFWNQLSEICKKQNIELGSGSVDFQNDSNNTSYTHLHLCKGNPSFKDSLMGDLYTDKNCIFEIKNNFYNIQSNSNTIKNYFQNNINYNKFFIKYKIISSYTVSNESHELDVYHTWGEIEKDTPMFTYTIKDFSYNFLPRGELVDSTLMNNLPPSWTGIWLSKFNDSLTWDDIFNMRGENNNMNNKINKENNMNEDIRDVYLKGRYPDIETDLEFDLYSDFSGELIYNTKKGIINKNDPIVGKVTRADYFSEFGTISELAAENTKREIYKGDIDFNDCLEEYKNEYQIPNYDKESYENIDTLIELVNKKGELFYLPKDFMNEQGIEADFDICEFLDDYVLVSEDDLYEAAKEEYIYEHEDFGDDSWHDDYIIEDISDVIDKKRIWYRVNDITNNSEKICNTIEEACNFAENELDDWYIERIVDNGEDIEIREAWSSENPLNKEDIITKENIIRDNLKEVE